METTVPFNHPSATSARPAPTGAWPAPQHRPRADAVGRAFVPLSPRELEILPLLAARWTDREIADELCISYRTVTTHVAHILNKLGVESRRAVGSHLAGRTGALSC